MRQRNAHILATRLSKQLAEIVARRDEYTAERFGLFLQCLTNLDQVPYCLL